MASPKQNVAFTWRQAFYLGSTLVASPTLAAGDAVVFTAGASTGNLNTLTSQTYGADCTASATQMNGTDVLIQFTDQTSPRAWDPFTVTMNLDVRNADDLATPTNITAGTLTTVTNLTNAPTNGDLTAAMKASVTTAASAATPSVTVSDKTGFSLSTAGILAIWHQLTAAVVTAGTMGKLILDNLDAAISSRLATLGYTAPLDAATTKAQVVAALITDTYAEPAAVPAATSSIKDKIGYLFTKTRNKVTQTATTQLVRNDADGATIATSAVSDDGTTFIKGKDA